MFPGDLDNLLQTVGYIGIFLIIFAETGLLIGLFLPGDSLLHRRVSGLPGCLRHLDSGHHLRGCRDRGRCAWLLDRQALRTAAVQETGITPVQAENLVLAEQFFLKHGGRAIILARFIPFARTFVPVIAGISAMPYRHFAMFNVAGALLWGAGLTLLGYFLGSVIPSVDHYLLPAIALILLISVLPSAYHLWKEKGDQIKDVTRVQLREIFGKGEPEAAPASSNEPTDSNSQS